MSIGIIFDADGTMLNSMRIWSELGERYLASLGIKAENALAQILYPMTLEESGKYFYEKYDIDGSLEKIIADMLMMIEDFYENEVEAKEGLAMFLKKMNEKNAVMGIATSGDKKLLQSALKRMGLLEYFNVIYTCSELGTTKREPYIYLKTAEALGTQPNKTVVFEDALYAVKTAKGAGFITVGTEDESSRGDREEIMKTADFYIKDFREAVDVIYESGIIDCRQ